MTFPEIFCPTNECCLVALYVDKQAHYLDQRSSKWSIGTSEGSNGAQ